MLLRSQVVQRAADDAVESGGLARDVAAAAVGAVHAAAERGEAFAAITVFGFVARKLDGHRGMTIGLDQFRDSQEQTLIALLRQPLARDTRLPAHRQ